MGTQPGDDRGDRSPAVRTLERDDQPAARTNGPGGRFRLRNWRVRWRLIALILIPTAVAVALGGLRIYSSMNTASTYGRVERVAQLGSDITGLVHDFAAERDLTAVYISSGRLAGQLGPVEQQQAKVDADVARIRGLLDKIDSSYGAQTAQSALTVRNRLDTILTLRNIATKTQMPVATVIDKYSESITDLLAFNDGITQSSADANLAATARAMADLSRGKEQASIQGGVLYSAIIDGRIGPTELSALLAAKSQEDSEIATFSSTATFPQLQFYQDTVIGPDVDLSLTLRQRAIAVGLSGGRAAQHLDVDPGKPAAQAADEWLNAENAKIGRMRQVEQRLAGDVISGSESRKSNAQRSAIISVALVAIVLLLVLVVTLLMAQSLVGPLRRLRSGALDVAGNRLPGLVRRLREPDIAESDFTVEPIDVDTTDEIGEVARAFDEVHREAVRLASNEALLRGNVNAMFVNLSRRSQSLIERQLRLIDDLEQGEQDSERLSSMFKLDHLATRMRRNCENLLVLGGQEQARRWNKPVPLVDVVRASLSEVEQYERIGLRVQGDVSVVGHVVNDLVHLVAELVENATTFSPEHTKVAVSGHLLAGGGAMLQISDNGLGMSAEELEDANWRLANPPVVDVSVSRRMGLFVVGRLAQRHGIRVELRSALSGGLTAFVLLPAQVIMQGNAQGAPPPRKFGDPGGFAESTIADAFAPADGLPAPVESKLNPVVSGARPKPLGAPPASPSLNSGFGPPDGAGSPYDGATDPWGIPPSRGPEPPYRGSNLDPHDTPPHGTPAAPDWAAEQPGWAAEQSGWPGEPQEPPGDPLPRRRPGEGMGRSVFADPPPSVPPQPPMRNLPPLDRAGAGASPGPVGPRRSPPPTRPPGPPANSGPPATPRGGFGGRQQSGGSSPIFEAMQSEWFQRRTGSPADPAPSRSWSSPGDAGWEAAETIRNPASGGHTASGLPKRVPGRNHVPGSATASQVPAQPAQARPADLVRDRFASFQQGVRRGRTQTRTEDEQETQ